MTAPGPRGPETKDEAFGTSLPVGTDGSSILREAWVAAYDSACPMERAAVIAITASTLSISAYSVVVAAASPEMIRDMSGPVALIRCFIRFPSRPNGDGITIRAADFFSLLGGKSRGSSGKTVGEPAVLGPGAEDVSALQQVMGPIVLER